MTACTYCDSEVEAHDPVYLQEPAEDGGRVEAGQFCNYACLKAYIDEEGLIFGASCSVDCC